MKMQKNVEFMAKNSHIIGAEASKVISQMPSQSLRMAVAVMIIVPIACAYPFFQRYVVQGLTVGSVKG
jgi:putative aldouronate transport system permease protein